MLRRGVFDVLRPRQVESGIVSLLTADQDGGAPSWIRVSRSSRRADATPAPVCCSTSMLLGGTSLADDYPVLLQASRYASHCLSAASAVASVHARTRSDTPSQARGASGAA